MIYFYTDDQEKWLINNASKYINSVTMTKNFNIKFDCNKNHVALNKKLHTLLPHYNFGHSGGKDKGFGSSSTTIGLGEEICKGGYFYVKTAKNTLSKNYTSKERNSNWKLKHRMIWELYNGDIPKNNIVIFLDGNRKNFEISNLYCISRKITTIMRRNLWFSDNAIITLTAIKWCELHYSII